MEWCSYRRIFHLVMAGSSSTWNIHFQRTHAWPEQWIKILRPILLWYARHYQNSQKIVSQILEPYGIMINTLPLPYDLTHFNGPFCQSYYIYTSLKSMTIIKTQSGISLINQTTFFFYIRVGIKKVWCNSIALFILPDPQI